MWLLFPSKMVDSNKKRKEFISEGDMATLLQRSFLFLFFFFLIIIIRFSSCWLFICVLFVVDMTPRRYWSCFRRWLTTPSRRWTGMSWWRRLVLESPVLESTSSYGAILLIEILSSPLTITLSFRSVLVMLNWVSKFSLFCCIANVYVSGLSWICWYFGILAC